MKKVITYGTFDLFHIGHLNILKRARALGDHLTVAVSTDEFCVEKGKQPSIPYKDRVEIVKALKCVDAVIPERSWEQKVSDISEHNISIFVMGNDWVGKFDDLCALCSVIYIPRTPDVSTTIIKTSIQAY